MCGLLSVFTFGKYRIAILTLQQNIVPIVIDIVARNLRRPLPQCISHYPSQFWLVCVCIAQVSRDRRRWVCVCIAQANRARLGSAGPILDSFAMEFAAAISFFPAAIGWRDS